VTALGLALDHGLNDFGAVFYDEALAPLRGHPGYLKLVEGLREPPYGRNSSEAVPP
jgi:hypothetical protein